MASFATACRLSVRLAGGRAASSRGFKTCTANLAAHNFTMPALSPTMTEGNIASWKVKEGDAFSAGDVILEIETDKASMDVEAQDDGIMAKIFLGDGSKQIQVGTRIGVLAEAGDDLSTLEIPAEEGSPKQESKQESKQTGSSSSPEVEAPAAPKKEKSPASNDAKPQTRPLLPSVEHLIHAEGLDISEVAKMTPTGPNNRLLKGDVLAYIGSIKSSYPADLASKINERSHLDLSNIKIAPPPAAPKSSKVEAKVPEVAPVSEVSLPISMSEVSKVQSRIQSTLGVFMPLSTFVARATDLANDDLPRSKTAKPTADELFNDILGVSNTSAPARGTFVPQIAAFSQSAPVTASRGSTSRKYDIIDILSGKKQVAMQAARLPGFGSDLNIFSVSVPKGDEKRAQIFLERVKAVLEAEPGRLVL